ncbi:hypothetical protein B0A50_05286 [Salinomyces thailandicus]|uniref:SET domain-containing protein n=1 Tax=Salinomyces thailandicus TaxID=706561 RepID=A0A4U0TVR2_9PEZI|nr:hypothetical protein B0A50_05286 [Salinomyces thailandica]
MSRYPQLFWPGLSHHKLHGFSPNPRETASLATKAAPPQEPTPHLEDRPPNLPKVEVRPSKERGLGLFAVERIPAYTRILEDYVLLALKPGEDFQDLIPTYQVLPKDLRTDFDTLNIPPHYGPFGRQLTNKFKALGFPKTEITDMVQVCCRFQSNSFQTSEPEDESSRRDPTELQKGSSSGLFLTAARINHSCTPNAYWHYRPSMGAQIVQSIQDIEAGDEIEIAYFSILQNRAARQQKSKGWGFQCACAACAPDGRSVGKDYEAVVAQVRESHTGFTPVIPGQDISKIIEPQITAWKAAVAHATGSRYPWLALGLPLLYQTQLSRCIMMAHFSTPKSDDEMFFYARSTYEWESKLTGADSPRSRAAKKTLDGLEQRNGMYDLLHGQAPGTHAAARSNKGS